MSYPKLGKYRHCVNQMREQYKVSAVDFDVVLYLAEHSVVSRDDLQKYVTKSRGTMTVSLDYLVEKQFIKVVREHRVGVRGMSATYSIAPKGRNMVTDFYMKLFPNHL
jgi:predicted transcriptional regulator